MAGRGDRAGRKQAGGDRERGPVFRTVVAASWNASPFLATVLLGVIGLVAAVSVAIVLTTGQLVDRVPDALRDGARSDAADSAELLLVIFAVLVLADQVLGSVQALVSGSLGRRMELDMRERVIVAATSPPGVAHLSDPGTRDAIESAAAVGTTNWGPIAAMMGFVPVATGLLSGLAMGVVVATFRWWLATILAVVWLWARARARVDSFELLAMTRNSTGIARRMDYFTSTALDGSAAKEIRVFGLGSWLTGRFHDSWIDAMEPVWRSRHRRRSRSLPVTVLVLAAANLAAFLVVGAAARDGQLDVGRVVALVQAILAMATIGRTRSVDEASLTFGAASMRPVFTLANTADLAVRESAIHRHGTRPSTGAAGVVALTGEIAFADVRYAYPRTAGEVLRGVELRIPAGRSMAIVGANGAGKTTLVKLLCGVLEPTAGEITIGGTPLESIGHDAWRSNLAVGFQDFLRYPATLRENVGFGAPSDVPDDAALDEIARRCDLGALVATLPKGWDTVLGRDFTGGVDLSGGEWQRVVLARSLWAARSGASILVLDEPTANLDVRSEASFYARFLEITEGLTTIVISHRYATVRRADSICVLEHGRVAELGSHEELLDRGGTYARLFQMQAAAFDEVGTADA